MALEIKMYTLLGGSTYITDIVSSSIYVSHLPDKAALPAIVFKRNISEPLYALSGYLSEEKVRMEVNCYTTSYKASQRLSTTVSRIMFDSTTFKAQEINNAMILEPINDRKNRFNMLTSFSCWNKT